MEKICDCNEKGWQYEDLQEQVTEALRKKKDIGTREQKNAVKVI